MTRRSLAYVAAAIALSGLLAAIAHGLRPTSMIAGGPFTEDGYYALAVAREASLGHGLSIPNGAASTPTDGVQPLWTLAQVPWFWLQRGDRFAPLRAISWVSTAIFAALAVVVARRAVVRARRRGAPVQASGALALALILGSFATFAQAHDGLETGLHLLTIALAASVIDAGSGFATSTFVFAVACWTRLDAALLLAAHALQSVVGFRSTKRLEFKAIGACAMATLSLAPWLARDVAIDGHWMPTSGRAESLHVHVDENMRAAALAIARWTVPILHRPVHAAPWSMVLDVAVAAALIAAIAWRRGTSSRAKPALLSTGERVLAGYVVLLAVFYVFAFGAPHFIARYLAPTLVLTVPIVATWLAERPRAAFAVLGVGVALNAPYFALSLRGTPAHENRFWTEQTALAFTRLDPTCTVGAGQTGTLGYFRDRVINLDGKVNPSALEARARGALPAFVRASAIDVVVDWPVYVDEALGVAHLGFHERARFGDEHVVWVREGRERCLTK